MQDQTRKTPDEIFQYAHSHDVAWMSQNTNHLPTYKAVREAIKKSIRDQEYSKYPISTGLPGLPEAIARDIGMPDYRVLVTAGGIEAIYIMTRALLKPEDEVITSDPSFFMIHKVIGLTGAKCTNLPVVETADVAGVHRPVEDGAVGDGFHRVAGVLHGHLGNDVGHYELDPGGLTGTAYDVYRHLVKWKKEKFLPSPPDIIKMS